MNNVENKKAVRKSILAKRDSLDNNLKNDMDSIIQEKFLKSDYYNNAEKIFIYISYGSEINTVGIIRRAMSDGKKVYVPRTVFKDKLMDAVQITSFDNLIEDRYGILEPRKEEPAEDPNEIDLIIVPGVTFDKDGGRMGYGAGYYDRYFKRLNKTGIVKLALAYDFQILNHVPMEEHDMPVDIIYTEEQDIFVQGK